MKFKSESADLVVWDAQKSKALCRFKNHECETNDTYIMDRLKDYEVIEADEAIPEVEVPMKKIEKPRKNKKKS